MIHEKQRYVFFDVVALQIAGISKQRVKTLRKVLASLANHSESLNLREHHYGKITRYIFRYLKLKKK